MKHHATPEDTPALTLLRPAGSCPELSIPLFADPCAAGFPSPAADYVEDELDLNALCIRRRAATFFVRASGSSMEGLGLYDGDVMVVGHAGGGGYSRRADRRVPEGGAAAALSEVVRRRVCEQIWLKNNQSDFG